MTRPSRGRRIASVVLASLLLLVGAPLAVVWFQMVRMPGRSAGRSLSPLTDAERATAARLRAFVQAGFAKERNLDHPVELTAAERFVESELGKAGLKASLETFEVSGVRCANVEAEIAGAARATEIVLVGAHYDSAEGAPGANDNGSGAAALLELAGRMAGRRFARTLRFVAFTNEEPPHFRKADRMGSRVHAARMKARGEKVVAMLSLETMGYFSDARGSQQYPFPFSLYYPSQGDFIGFVSSLEAAPFVRRSVGLFRETATIPSEGGALPGKLPGVGWSDHESFTLLGVPALMVTDTAPFRYPHYHTEADTPDKLDYEGLARVVVGLVHVVEGLADGP